MRTLGSSHFNPGYEGGGFFDRGMKLVSIILWGYETFKENVYVVQNYFIERWWGTIFFLFSRWGMNLFVIM